MHIDAAENIADNEVLRQLAQRRSVRVFTAQPIGAAVRQAILEAAAQAPTAGCQQLYTIIDVQDPAKKQALADSCDHQPFIAGAPLVLVFCADPLKWYDAYTAEGCGPRPLGVGDLLLAVDDALIAAQNAVTAAWSLGVGSCYIGDIMENRAVQKEILGLPDRVFPAALVVFGYPTPQQQTRPKPPRADLRHIVHTDTYRRMDPAELREMLAANAAGRPYGAWLEAFCRRKYNAGFSREMTRSVAEFLKEFEEPEV